MPESCPHGMAGLQQGSSSGTHRSSSRCSCCRARSRCGSRPRQHYPTALGCIAAERTLAGVTEQRRAAESRMERGTVMVRGWGYSWGCTAGEREREKMARGRGSCLERMRPHNCPCSVCPAPWAGIRMDCDCEYVEWEILCTGCSAEARKIPTTSLWQKHAPNIVCARAA